MTTEQGKVLPVKQPYTFFENAINEGIRESGLAGKLQESFDLQSIRDYLTVLMGAFISHDSMYAGYYLQRAKFAMLAGDNYFDAVIKTLHEGDVGLFQGLFLSGIYRRETTWSASKSYHTASGMIKGDSQEHSFLKFLSEKTADVMEVVSYASESINIKQRKDSTKLYLPAIEKHKEHIGLA